MAPALRAARVVLRVDHVLEHLLDLPLWTGEQIEAPAQRLLRSHVEHVEDRSGENLLRRQVPVILPSVAVGIDEHVGDFLDVADLLRSLTHLEEWVVPGGGAVLAGGIELEADAPELAPPPARGECPVLALDVVHKYRVRPGEQRRKHPPDALTRARRREAEDVLQAVVAQGENAVAVHPAADVDAGGV